MGREERPVGGECRLVGSKDLKLASWVGARRRLVDVVEWLALGA